MSPFPKCKICGYPHAKALAHIWDDTSPAHGGTVDTSSLKLAVEKHEGANPSGPTIIEQPVAQPGSASALGAESRQFKSDPADQPFDRTTYQREYMRDLPKAKAEGLTVKQWREKHKND